VRPIELGPNQIRRFYRGGSRIAAFRGTETDDQGPEDWVGSATTARGDERLGRSEVADRFEEEPEAFFGPGQAGNEPRLLVKLLDAGQRLPVHFHPDDAFAQSHLGTRYGKAEAWIILEAEPGASVHLGFARNVSAEKLEAWVAAQDVEAMIDAMVRLPVAAGDSVFVPAGLAHVIGEGILLLELQQPSDLSLLLEWRGVVEERDAFLGLERELALSAAARLRLNDEDVDRLTQTRGDALFPPEADRFFRAEWVGGGSTLEPSFSILVVSEGEGALEPDSGDALPVRRGSTVLVPYAAGTCELTGSFRAIRCRPPAR
jgi:mannose-6-phosphate isomerase